MDVFVPSGRLLFCTDWKWLCFRSFFFFYSFYFLNSDFKNRPCNTARQTFHRKCAARKGAGSADKPATSCYIISADGPSARSRSLPLGTRFEPFVFLSALLYLMVYRMVPFFIMRKSLFGAVMLWATDFLPFLKKVSGVQTLVTIRLLSRKISIGPSYINLRSTHVCRKNTSIVYSWMRGVGRGGGGGGKCWSKKQYTCCQSTRK